MSTLSACSPPVFSSTTSPAFSIRPRPVGVAVDRSEIFSLASSRNPMRAPWAGRPRWRRVVATLATCRTLRPRAVDERQPPIVAVVGATASGKTELSLDLAERLGGEIVNTDAMQLYAGMDVGTAKLPVAERRGIPHHLLDVLEVTESASVAVFQQRAREVIADAPRSAARRRCWSAGRRSTPGPSSTGSTSPAPTTRSAAAGRPSSTGSGAPALHARAGRARPRGGRRDPARERPPDRAGARGDRADRASRTRPRCRGSSTSTRGPSRSASTSTARSWTGGSRRGSTRCSTPASSTRSARLLDAGLAEGRTASRAIGYREVAAYLRGETSEDEAREATKAATRRFARRQDSWFRKDPRVEWVAVGRPDVPRGGAGGRARAS